MAASTTDVREWARAEGIEIKGHGRIPGTIRERYEEAHADMMAGLLPAAAEPEPAPEPGEADYDGGVSAADFITADEPAEPEFIPADIPAPGGPAEPAADGARMPAGERRPRAIARQRKTGKTFRERVWGGGGAKPARPAKKHPRVSLRGLAEDTFLDMAWTFQALPPLEKILYLQAPLAGTVVEQTFKGTAVDTVLQPVARFDRQFKALEALTAPAWVAGIMLRGRRDEAGEYDPATKLMFSGLRHSLLSMSRVVGDFDFEVQRAKADELRSASGQIDAMIAYLFEMPEMTEEQLQQMAAAQAAAANGA